MKNTKALTLLASSIATLLLVASPIFAQKSAKKTNPPVKPSSVAVKPSAVETSYFGLYIGAKKIGYMVTKTQKNVPYEGKTVTKAESETTIKMNMLGSVNTTTSTTLSFTDSKTSLPIKSYSKTNAAGRINTVTTTYTPQSVSYVASIQGNERKGTLELKPGERFLVDSQDGNDIVLKPGMSLKGKIFNSDQFTLMDSEMACVSEELVEDLNGKMIQGFRIEDRNPILPAIILTTQKGDVLRINTRVGFNFRKVSRTVAMAPNDSNLDLANEMARTPMGKPLLNPYKLRRVVYEIGGVTRPFPADDNVQQSILEKNFSEETKPLEKGEKTLRVTITNGPLPETAGVALFSSLAPVPERLRPYLKASEYVNSDKPVYKEIAQKILGDEKDCAKAAAKIAVYVHNAIKADPSIGAVRTADDILKDPRGVCRDYTTLYATIARAAGLPTKQCMGMGYASGTFQYHAWPEVWVGVDAAGKDTWVALEPTWGMPFADACHIKIAEGEINDVMNVAADMRSYRIKVIEFSETP
jgi:transglutaminase-like putative cysteine protease